MISGIEVSNFKGFRHLELSGLGCFHVLVGPNGSGKSSFFEIFEFVKDLLLFDVQEAVSRRNVSSLRDLTFDRLGGEIRLLITFDKSLFNDESVRYLVNLSESVSSGAAIVSESLIKGLRPEEFILTRNDDERVSYKREDALDFDFFPFARTHSALAQVRPDEQRYPTANRVKRLLTTDVQSLRLDSQLMGKECPTRLPATELLPDGRNLARVAGRLLKAGPDEWIYHLKLALEDLEYIFLRQQVEGGTEELVLHYRDGLEIPSRLASFGTLRTLALTLPAFLPADQPKLYLFEEPENGIHPKAIEIVMDAIQSIPNAQTFVTTHSPMIVQQSGVESLLLFSKRNREIVVQHGGDNPILRDLNGVPDLATVFASRVLG